VQISQRPLCGDRRAAGAQAPHSEEVRASEPILIDWCKSRTTRPIAQTRLRIPTLQHPRLPPQAQVLGDRRRPLPESRANSPDEKAKHAPPSNFGRRQRGHGPRLSARQARAPSFCAQHTGQFCRAVARSPSESLRRPFNWLLSIRFSAAQRSLRKPNSWSKVPVMYIGKRAHSISPPIAAPARDAILECPASIVTISTFWPYGERSDSVSRVCCG
jgi:hypothetical protein